MSILDEFYECDFRLLDETFAKLAQYAALDREVQLAFLKMDIAWRHVRA
jgi:hypothetical protein